MGEKMNFQTASEWITQLSIPLNLKAPTTVKYKYLLKTIAIHSLIKH
jgi:hypothetical protein